MQCVQYVTVLEYSCFIHSTKNMYVIGTYILLVTTSADVLHEGIFQSFLIGHSLYEECKRCFIYLEIMKL